MRDVEMWAPGAGLNPVSGQSSTSPGVSDLVPNWARLVPNETNLGHIFIDQISVHFAL